MRDEVLSRPVAAANRHLHLRADSRNPLLYPAKIALCEVEPDFPDTEQGSLLGDIGERFAAIHRLTDIPAEVLRQVSIAPCDSLL